MTPEKVGPHSRALLHFLIRDRHKPSSVHLKTIEQRKEGKTREGGKTEGMVAVK